MRVGQGSRTTRAGRSLLLVGLVAGLLVPTAGTGAVPDPLGIVPVGVDDIVTPPADVPLAGPVKAGVAVVDATWHVGATAGQYAHKVYDSGIHGGGVDPHLHQTTAWPSYGLESRSDVRALVIEAHDGDRLAVVSNDLYIPQDLVNRRVATILEERDLRIRAGLEAGHITDIREENLTVPVSHSHTSVYLSSPSWGVWAFQDVFDIRFFEYVAQAMADAVVQASEPASMVRVRMAAAEVPYSATHRHSYGPQIADDGTPAGYPDTDNDHKVTVVRLDEIGAHGNAQGPPAPFAVWVTYGLHPEMLDGNDILSGEWVNAMYRMVDAETGATTLFSQRNIGTAEPARDAQAHPPEARAEFSHQEYAQMHRAARLVADAVLQAWEDAGEGEARPGGSVVPFRDEFEVAIRDLRFAPPSLRFLPTVSNCRAEQLFGGNPPVPVAGLPDCEHPAEGVWPGGAFDPGVTYDTLRQAGVPVPDNVPGPSYTGLQETIQVHLQAIRLGEVGITVCPCEQFADQSRNIESRLDRESDNLWIGFKWWEQKTPTGRDWCVDNGDSTWTCADPRNGGGTDLPPVPDLAYRRMVAQVENDATGWEELAHAPYAETDPADPTEIKGNYTHEEIAEPHRYDLVVPVGMANDYWGYIVSYREFQAHDHYRKALTGLGPHSSDFLATRLTRMAAELKGGPKVSQTAKDIAYRVENEHQRNRARAIGEIAEQYLPAYAATLPADGGAPAILDQPESIERFDATSLRWVGGSNWFDLPEVKVQRLEPGGGHGQGSVNGQGQGNGPPGEWVDFGDTTGHVQYRVDYPDEGELADWRTGNFEWVWSANFEAFASDVTLADARGRPFRATPAGTYRLVVEGVHHDGLGETSPYALASDPFTVGAWTGIVPRLASDPATGTVTIAFSDPSSYFEGRIDYPDSYDAPVFDEFIDPTREERPPGSGEQFCFHCSFRPWLDVGDAVSAVVEFTLADGSTIVVEAGCSDGTCSASVPTGAQSARVPAGAVEDAFGNTNGAASGALTL